MQGRGASEHRKVPSVRRAPPADAKRSALGAQTVAVNATELAHQFKAARADHVARLLQTLATLGQAREIEPGRFVA